MVTCYVAKNSAGDTVAIYERRGNTLSLVNNRHFKSTFSDDGDAERQVAKHVQKFLSNRLVPEIEIQELAIGTYHPSIARPIYPSRKGTLVNLDFASEIQTVRKIERELSMLIKDLESCFLTVTPDARNLSAFGGYFEKIIFGACVGVESLFKKALTDNNVIKEKYTTSDFVRLKGALKIDQYVVSIPRYPWLEVAKPFIGWSKRLSQDSPQWYVAYNSLKHDRLTNDNRASMKNAIDACCAYFITAVSMFGYDVFNLKWESDLHFFSVNEKPNWNIEEHYIEAEQQAWSPIYADLDQA